MHEVSIAESLLDLAMQNLPAGASLRSVCVQAGPMRAIDDDSMQWAWQQVVTARSLPCVRLNLQQLPWKMHCPACNKTWESPEYAAECPCGCPSTEVIGGHELQLVSAEIDD